MIKRLWLDVETSGRDPKAHGIVEIGAEIEIAGEIKGEFHSYVCPSLTECIIEEEALKVNQLKMDDILAAPKESEVLHNFTLWLNPYINCFNKLDKARLYAYNTHFDANFLMELAFRNKFKYIQSYIALPGIDVMATAVLLSELNPNFNPPNFKLATVCGYRGIMGDWHTSLGDVKATRELHYNLLPLLKGALNASEILGDKETAS